LHHGHLPKFDYVCIHLFSETTHFCPFQTPLIFCPNLCRRILTYAREDNESSTWDSTRLQTVVFVMWSFWPFVSCPATQYAICNNFCTSCLQHKISKIPCNKNVSSHIATEIAILSQSDFNSRKKKIQWMQYPEEWRHNFFNKSESSILLSSATLLALYFPHLHLNNAQSCTKSRHLFASSQKPNHKSTTIAALSQTCWESQFPKFAVYENTKNHVEITRHKNFSFCSKISVNFVWPVKFDQSETKFLMVTWDVDTG